MKSPFTIWLGNRPRSADIPREAQLKKGIPEERIGTFTIYEPVGCEHCNDSDKG
jgi:type IV pilus assembly protein PilB